MNSRSSAPARHRSDRTPPTAESPLIKTTVMRPAREIVPCGSRHLLGAITPAWLRLIRLQVRFLLGRCARP